MSFEHWLIFLPAAFALNVFPGPNNLLSLTNGARYGFRISFLAGFGRLPAFAVMVALTAVGLGALLAASQTAFIVLKWVGALYLFYLGIMMLRARAASIAADAVAETPRSLKSLWRQDFFVATSNPKAMAVFTAFLPQFIVPGDAVWLQLGLMGSAFTLMEIAAIAIYAFFGARLRGYAQSPRGMRWINRGSGGALLAAGTALLMSRHAAAG